VLADAVKPASQGVATAGFGQSAEAFFAAGADWTTDIDGVAVNDEKGASPLRPAHETPGEGGASAA